MPWVTVAGCSLLCRKNGRIDETKADLRHTVARRLGGRAKRKARRFTPGELPGGEPSTEDKPCPHALKINIMGLLSIATGSSSRSGNQPADLTPPLSDLFYMPKGLFRKQEENLCVVISTAGRTLWNDDEISRRRAPRNDKVDFLRDHQKGNPLILSVKRGDSHEHIWKRMFSDGEGQCRDGIYLHSR